MLEVEGALQHASGWLPFRKLDRGNHRGDPHVASTVGISGGRHGLELRDESSHRDCSGCTIGDDDTGSCTGGISIASTPISDGIATSLSAIEDAHLGGPHVTLPSLLRTRESFRLTALFVSIVSTRVGRVCARRSMGISPSPGWGLVETRKQALIRSRREPLLL